MYKIGTTIRTVLSNILKQKVWLPGMGSNHKLDRILKSHGLFYKVVEVVKSIKSRHLVRKNLSGVTLSGGASNIDGHRSAVVFSFGSV